MRTVKLYMLAFAAVGLLAASVPAHAAFPVTGSWSYDNASQPGRAQRCGNRVMRFDGVMRYDTETAAPDYRNLSVQKIGNDTWYLVDQVYTVVAWGRVHYTLRIIDDDHIVIRLQKGGATWMLRRCG